VKVTEPKSPPLPVPYERPRRLRRTARIRDIVRETELRRSDLIQPLFIVPGSGVRQEISSMPGQFHMSSDEAGEEARRLVDAGVPAVILFGIPEYKDPVGSSSWAEDGVVQKALASMREAAGDDLALITDVCMCEYTDHGHCGVLHGETVANDPTLELLARQAVSHADAGADIVAPSDMMDGRVAAIRAALDASGHSELAILSYAAKYASGFYGPFRDAAQSAPSFGDRAGYQMDPANAREALREILLDVEEGADIVMVKPAMPYLDIVRAAREHTAVPVCAYQVSGEYAMIRSAADRGLIDYKRVVLESLVCIRRAGADMVLSYFSKEVAGWLPA